MASAFGPRQAMYPLRCQPAISLPHRSHLHPSRPHPHHPKRPLKTPPPHASHPQASISNLLYKRLRRQTEGVTRINDPNAYVVPATRRVSCDCRPLVSAVRLWNALPQEFKSLACHRSFKRLFKKVYFFG